MYRDKFKKFGGAHIPDIIEYIKEYIDSFPTATISIGCDSIQKRRKTVYAITIMMYDGDIKNGAHVVFFRDNVEKIKNNEDRLYREAKYLHDVGMYIDSELSKFWTRGDLSDNEIKRYKYHIARCNGEYAHVQAHNEDSLIKSMSLTPLDRTMTTKLVDLHVDFNPFEGTMNDKGVRRNKSFISYKSFVPWLRGMGFRTWAKPDAPASTTAADLLVQD